MRIGFFSDTYLPKTFGTEISMETFKNQLEKLGHEVFVFAPSFQRVRSTEKIWRLPSFKIKAIPEEKMMWWSRKVVKKITDLKLDLVHVHTPFSAGWLARKVARKAKIPLVYTSHMLYPEYAKYWLIKNNKILPFLMKLYLKIYGNLCDALIAPSLKMKKLLESYGVKKPITVLPTGLDFKKLEAPLTRDTETKKRLKIPAENKVLLYVGRLTHEKNVDFLVDAFAKVYEKRKDVSFVLVGDGYLMDGLKARAKKLGFASQVVFTGRISWEEVLKIYQAVDIFVFASLTDTQGLIIIEAGHFGLPIVALKDDCYAGMLVDGQNGYTVYPYETSLFAEKVLTLLNNEKLWQEFSQNGQTMAKNFSAEKQAKKLVEIYHEFIDNYKKKKNS